MDITVKQAEEILTAYYKLYFDKPSYSEIVEIYKRRKANLDKIKETD